MVIAEDVPINWFWRKSCGAHITEADLVGEPTAIAKEPTAIFDKPSIKRQSYHTKCARINDWGNPQPCGDDGEDGSYVSETMDNLGVLSRQACVSRKNVAYL